MEKISLEPGNRYRNVYFYGTMGAGSHPVVVGGFYTYGDTQWSSVYTWCRLLWLPDSPVVWDDLRFFHYEPSTNRTGTMLAIGTDIVRQGAYIVRDMNAAEVLLSVSAYRCRKRVPTLPDAQACNDHYLTRSRLRDDNTCLITRLHPETPARRLKAVHIFSRAFDLEWNKKGYASLITDSASPSSIGATKIDSMQNVITLRTDLRDAWEAFELGVDVHDNYKVIAFTGGNDDVHGRNLQLDHIRDPTLRPLDVLLEDHFQQCVFKYMCGTGEKAEA